MSTHYVKIVDLISSNDNVFVLKQEDGINKCIRYLDNGESDEKLNGFGKELILLKRQLIL
ncbi:MAG: hypothetical protein WCR33_05495 [Bacilli bacterium]